MKFRDLLNVVLKPLKVELKKIGPGWETIDWWPAEVAHYLKESPEVVFDVGANRGQTIEKLSKIWPQAKIHSFEPNPEACEQIRQNIPVNKNINIYPMALGATPGQMTLHVLEHSPSSSLLSASPNWREYVQKQSYELKKEVTVEVSTVDMMAAKLNINHIDLLKIDTQGFDLQVLRGAQGLLRRGAIGAIFCETMFAELYQSQAYYHQIVEYLNELGYGIGGWYDWGRHTDGTMIACDTLFFKKQK